MGLNIKNEEVLKTVRKLSQLTGLNLTQAILTAVQEKLTRVERQQLAQRKNIASQLDVISAQGSTLPILDRRTPDEILGYDDAGVPS